MLRILYVEDNAVNRMVMSRWLRDRAQLTLAENVAAARALFPAETFDLILMDINLGEDGLDGTTLMQQLRADHPSLQGVPFWAVTAYAQGDSELFFLDAGFDAYYPKPLTREAFLAALDRLAPG